MVKKIPKKHQLDFQSSDKLLLGDSGGTGKTLTAILWAELYLKNGYGIVVTTKDAIQKWKEELIDQFGVDGAKRFDVLHYEYFRKKKAPRCGDYDVIILDEAHKAASPLFVAGRSQQTTGIYEMIRNNNARVLPVTATLIRSNPWNLHTLLTFAGKYVEWKEWRDYFFEKVKPKWSAFPVWMEKPNWRKMLVPVIKKYARTLLMSDLTDVPPISDYYLKVPTPKFNIETQEEWSPAKVFHEKRKWENGEYKLKFVKELVSQYRKAIIVFYYIEQGEKWFEELSKDRKCYLAYGQSKDRESIIKQANEDEECLLLVQSQMSAAWDGDGFDTIIFATPGYPYVDYAQMRWRVTRIKDLKPVQYIHLIGGPADAAVLRQLKHGRDFSPEYFNKSSTSTEIEEEE